MPEFVSLIKWGCCSLTVIALGFMGLLALPQSRLRLVGVAVAKWVAAALLVLLVPSPVDILPDVLPLLGWADDLGYIVGAIVLGRSALSDHGKQKLLEGAELSRALDGRKEVAQ